MLQVPVVLPHLTKEADTRLQRKRWQADPETAAERGRFGVRGG